MATTFHTAIFTREGTLGLTIAECETSAAAVVASVKPGGAAQSRRVRPGDVISKVNGRRVGGYADAARAIASAGRPLTLVLERSSQPLAENAPRRVTPEEFEVPPEKPSWTKSSLTELPPPPPSPGVVVRFEGHVNSTCDLDCRGATGKPCKAARKVGSDMCARCPGGAYGLSKARAEAIKSFVAKCGVDTDRVYAVGFAGTRRLSDDITEEKGAVNRRVEVHMMPYAPPGRL